VRGLPITSLRGCSPAAIVVSKLLVSTAISPSAANAFVPVFHQRYRTAAGVALNAPGTDVVDRPA